MFRRVKWIATLTTIAGLCLCLSTASAAPLDALGSLLQRTSVRAFDPNRPVRDAELQAIMRAGWNTRTVDGSRPFEFIQIRDRATLKALAGASKFAKWLTKAPAAIAVVVRTDESPKFFRENGALAVMNMYHQAQQLGLGTTFQGTANRKAMKRILGVGKNRHLLSVLPVGAPRPNAKLKSPARAGLDQTVWQGQIGRAATLFAGTTPAKSGKRAMASFLGAVHDEVVAFSGRSVEAGKLRTAFEAMRAAPSSKNRQPWRWVLVSDRATKQRIARAAKDRTLAAAPVVAVLAGALKPPPARFGSQLRHDPHNNVKPGAKLTHFFLRHDVSCALSNLRIGAESQGLATRVAMFGRRGERQARALLSPGKGAISRHRMKMVAAVGIGYAGKTARRRANPLPARRVFRERHARR